MGPVQMLIKPASGNCNMRCNYCFYYDEMSKRATGNYGLMSLETLEALVKKALADSRGRCDFVFQGGEPTLVGLDFYQKLLELEETYNVNKVQVSNSIQTNGFGINEEWAGFLAEHHFLTGLSLDGIKYTHDAYRHTIEGGGTFERIMKTAGLFDRYGVEYNILTVVNRTTAERIERIYEFYRKNGWCYQQYIACLDPVGEKAGLHEYSLTPEGYGDFLIRLFDLWYMDLKKGQQPFIRQFENYVAILMGYVPEACDQRGHCGIQYVVEADGSVYPCDFYVMDQYRMGNIVTDSLEELRENEAGKAFVAASLSQPEECRACPYAGICRGGCRRSREILENGSLGLNYFCLAYKRFFKVALPRLQEIAAALKRSR